MISVDKFYEKFELNSKTKFHEKFMPAQYHGELYHYTSPGGLASILFGDPNAMTLRASRFDAQNDASEGKIALEVYNKVCEKFGNISGFSVDDLKSIAPTRTLLMQSMVHGKIKTTRPECTAYICCFSKNPDSLPMWNYYSKANAYEGFNIGLDIGKINDSLSKNYKDIEVSSKIYPVIYDQQQQEELVESFLQKVLSHYRPGYETSVRYIISNQLAMWKLVFKHKCFEHEGEVRVIVSAAKATTTKKSPIDIKYRANGMYIIPYIEMKLDKSCVTSLVFGPVQWDKAQKQEQDKFIKDILRQNQYSASVAYSEIPVKY